LAGKDIGLFAFVTEIFLMTYKRTRN
jgi:hypothetical protein